MLQGLFEQVLGGLLAPVLCRETGGEDESVIGQCRLGPAMLGAGLGELVRDVPACHPPVGVDADQEPGVVVDEVEYFGVAAVGQPPVGEVRLPHLVGKGGLEADERGFGALPGLVGDLCCLSEDAVDRGFRRGRVAFLFQVDPDGFRSCVQALRGQVLAEEDDAFADVFGSAVRSGLGSFGSWFVCGFAFTGVAAEELLDPPFGDVEVLRGRLGGHGCLGDGHDDGLVC